MAAIVLASCTPFHLSNLHTSSTGVPQTLSLVALASEPVAVIPAVAPAALQGYTITVSQALSTALSKTEPPLKGIPAFETINRLNEQGLVAEYVEMASDFVRSGVFDRRRLKRIGSALGVKYLLQPGLSDFQETIADRYMLGGWRLVKIRVATLRLWLRLWDSQTGTILWEVTGGVTVTSELVEEMPTIPVNEIAEQLWLRMVQKELLSENTRTLSRD